MWPTIVGLLSRSEVPIVLSRWSRGFFAWNVLNLLVVGLVLLAFRRGRAGLLQVGYLLLIALTVIAPMNNALRDLPGLLWWMPLTRLAAGAAGLVCGFMLYRRAGRGGGAVMTAAVAVIALSVLDFALLAWLAVAPDRRMDDTGLRESYDLGRVTERDVVLVGDSFVWGQGVEKDERFGDRLEALLATHGLDSRVYSLGRKGIGLPEYIELLAAMPGGVVAGEVIVAFYMNDMPAHETAQRKVQDLAGAVGRGFPSARLVGDKLARLLTHDVPAYHASVVASWDEGGPSFSRRHRLLEEQLADLGRLSAERSARPPLLLVLPLMVDFAQYPLDGAHARLAAVAEQAGFDVLDLLPVFRERLGNGDAHRSGPDDNHFDAETHALVAGVLFGRLAGPAPARDRNSTSRVRSGGVREAAAAIPWVDRAGGALPEGLEKGPLMPGELPPCNGDPFFTDYLASSLSTGPIALGQGQVTTVRSAIRGRDSMTTIDREGVQ